MNTSRAWSMDARLLEVFEQLRLHGRVLVIVDQPASIGALAVALAHSLGLHIHTALERLVGQIGGDHQQAGQMLQGLLGQGGQIDTAQRGELLQEVGIDPQQLDNGGYQQHLDNQNQPDFQHYGQGQQQGGYEQGQQQGGH